MESVIEYEERYLEEIIDFWIKIYVKEHKLITWEEDIINTFQDIQFLKLWMIIDQNQEIVATIGLQEVDHKIEIKRLCVRQEERGKGLARQIMNLALNYIKTYQPEKEVLLGTHQVFDKAIQFYEKIGFEKIGMLENGHTIVYKLENRNW